MPRPPIAAALLLVSLSAGATPLDDAREARTRVDAALAAHGGVDKIEALGALTVVVAGERFMFGQSRTLGGLDAETSRLTTSFDRAHDRIAQESEQGYPGGYLLRYRTVLTATDGYNLDIGRNFDGPVIDRSPGADLAGGRALMARELPPLLLLHARERAATLRTTAGGVSFAEGDGTIIDLRLDAATRLLTGFEIVVDNFLIGDMDFAVEWSGRQTVGGLILPTSVVEKRNGKTARTGTIEVELAALPDEHFGIPAGFAEAQPAKEPVQRLADGIGLVEGLPGDSQPMYVELSDSVVVIEAPNGSGTSEAAIAKIAAATHGKPIRALAFTHPHNDHAAGLRPYIARGITILTPPVWKPYVDALAAAPHSFAPDRLSGAPRAPIVETWTGEKVITDGKRTIRLVAMGPTPHCEETVVAWIPDAGVLYQGDSLIIPKTAPKVLPGAALTRALVDLIRAKKWDVKVIAGTHGRPGTMAELAASAAQMR